MPTLKNKICCHPGCGAVAQARYCDKHRKQRYTEANAYAHKHRDAGWYNRAAWQRARRHQLNAYPLCAHCLTHTRITPATVVDHINPRSQGGDDLDPNNLQSLCKPCHDTKTAHENNLGTLIKDHQ